MIPDTEHQLRAEIERLVNVLAEKTEIIAALQAANAELHERAERAKRRRRTPPHICAGCGRPLDDDAIAWADPGRRGWLCATCREG